MALISGRTFMSTMLTLILTSSFLDAASITFLNKSLTSSYAVYEDWDASTYARIKFQFKTAERDGLLLYIEDLPIRRKGRPKNYLSLRLESEELVMEIKMGGRSHTPGVQKNIGGNLNDLQWHEVELFRNYRTTTIILDGMEEKVSNALSSQSSNDKGSLGVESSLLYIGGIPEDGPKTKGNIGFVGCIKDVEYKDGYQTFRKGRLFKRGPKTERGCRNACDAKPYVCPNGGKCVNGVTSYSCDCFATGYEGKKCETPSKVISLVSRTTFITREDLNIRSKMSNRIKLRFKTRDKVGILVTVGKAHDYMTLEIYKGYLRLSIDVGGGPMIFKSQYRVHDGHWHSVDISQRAGYISLDLDNGQYNETKSSPSGFTKDKCRERNEHVYFGGHFNPIHVIGSLSKIGFSGCLQHIYYNDADIIDTALKLAKRGGKALDMRIDGLIKQECNVKGTTLPPVPDVTTPPKRNAPTNGGSDNNVSTGRRNGENDNSVSTGKVKQPSSESIGTKLGENSVAWITAGIVIGAVILIMAIGFLIYHFRKKYRGSFIARETQHHYYTEHLSYCGSENSGRRTSSLPRGGTHV